MQNRKRWLLITIAAVTVTIAGIVAGSLLSRVIHRSTPPAKPAFDTSLAPGQLIPDGRFHSMDGFAVDLRDWLGGHATVIVVLSTECEPCHDLASEWNDVFANLALNVVAISVEQPDQVREFLDRYGIGVPVLIDPERAWTSEHRLPAFPTFIGVDASGTIVWTDVGYARGAGGGIAALLARL